MGPILIPSDYRVSLNIALQQYIYMHDSLRSTSVFISYNDT